MATIANRIKEAMTIRGMKQVDLVSLTGIGKSSISTYLSGEYEPKQRNIYKIAKALDVSEAWLMGEDVPMERFDYSELLSSIAEENKSGRTAAVEELRRTYGTEYSIHSTYSCDDKKRATLLYYKTLERDVALSLADIISTVDHLDGRQAEKVTLLLHAYLKAEQPIRNIVDTALRPYVEDLDDLLCGGSRIG
jgi:transcriptional regulator with XRE-family HTH domain|nr:MAG TPA_asm: bifunctional HTH-domain containing protein/aminotransferase [Caudoviricetes sp.]